MNGLEFRTEDSYSLGSFEEVAVELPTYEKVNFEIIYDKGIFFINIDMDYEKLVAYMPIELCKENKQKIYTIESNSYQESLGYIIPDGWEETQLIDNQGKELILQTSSGTVELGRAKVPYILELNNLTKDGNVQFNFVKKGTQEEISINQLIEMGVVKVEIKSNSGSEAYDIYIDGSGVTSVNASVQNNTFNISNVEGGLYEVSVKNRNDNVIFSAELQAINQGVFNAILERNGESREYKLVFTESVKKLKEINNEKDFEIYIYDTETGNKILETKSNKAKDDKYIEIADKYSLFTYDNVTVYFYNKDTGLNKNITIPVPKLGDTSNLKGTVEYPGTVRIYTQDDKAVTIVNLVAILGYSETGDLKYSLTYKPGGVDILDSISDMSFFKKDKDFEFENVEFGLKVENITAESAYEIYNLIKNIYNYYKYINGPDTDKLYLKIESATDKETEIEIEKPDIQGNYPWFEAITGVSYEYFGEYVKKLEEILQEQGILTFLTEEDMTLEISESETYKNFVAPASGLYYIFEETETGVYSRTPYIQLNKDTTKEPPLRFGGKLIGAVKDGKPVGQYASYDMETGNIKWTYVESEANCYPLVAGAIYRCRNSEVPQNITWKFVRLDIAGKNSEYELVEICDETSDEGMNRASQHIEAGYDIVKEGFISYDKKSTSLFDQLEALLSKCVRGLANGLNYLVQMSLRAVGGEPIATTVDIDSILFNHYPDTSIDFFKKQKSVLGSENMEVEEPSKMIKMFKDAVNDWYNKFTAIAIAGYIVILLYIGVKILLGSTGKNKAQFKELLLAWGTGLILLFFFPYVIKYSIALNNSLVKMIEDSKSGALNITTTKSKIDMSGFTLPTVADEDDYGAVASQMDVIPFSDSDNSYMAEMARKAESSKKLVDAFVYLIMVIQFIMIVIMYYKRVFIIAFLIVLFPFVALAYAIDKIIDDKAQAFAVWCRELMINIFIQSIHALIYVFVMGAVYASGEYSGDWLLAIIGITFLFKGEQILKKIIGQEGTTVRNLKDTATRTVATITAAKTLTKNVADNYIGRDSHLGRAITAHRQYRTEKKIAKTMGVMAEPPKLMPIAPKGNTLDTFNANLAGNSEYNDLADAIQVVNNRNQVTDPKELGEALDKVLSNRNSKDPNIQNLMRGLNLSDDQLRALDKLQKGMVDNAIDAKKGDPKDYATQKQKIDADLDLKLQVIFPESREKREFMKRAMYYSLRDGNRERKHRKRALGRRDVTDEYTAAKNRRKSFYYPEKIKERSGIVNPFAETAKPTALSNSATKTKNRVLSYYQGEVGKKEEKFANSVAILKDFKNLNHATSKNVTKYTSKQVMEAANYLAEHEADSDNNKAIVSDVLGIEAEEIKAIVSEEVCRQYTDLSPKTHRYNFRKDEKRGVRKVEISEGTHMEKAIARKHIEESWHMAMDNIKKDDANVRNGVCSEESLNRVSVKEKLKMEREAGYGEDVLIDKIIQERDHENYNEIIMVEDFAREQLADLPKWSNETTYDGLTKKEHEEKAKNLKKKYVEELTRVGTTTTGIVLGAPIGAGLGIGIGDENSAVEEALRGASAGALLGDATAETVMGRETKKQKIKVFNPYTGEIDELDLKTQGVTADVKGKIDENEVLTVDDPRLNIGMLRYDLDIKLLEKKRQYERKQEVERRRAIYDEALRSSTPRIINSTQNPSRRLNIPNNTQNRNGLNGPNNRNS